VCPSASGDGEKHGNAWVGGVVMRRVGASPRAIRTGILAIRGYRVVMGTYNFDCHCDGLHQNTIVRDVKGRPLVNKVIPITVSGGC